MTENPPARPGTSGIRIIIPVVNCEHTSVQISNYYLHISHLALQRKSHLCIPFLDIARPQSQFPHSCVFDRFIYSQDRSTYFLQKNRQVDRGNVGTLRINSSQTHECGNWYCGRAIPILGIFVSNFGIGSLCSMAALQQQSLASVINFKIC